MFVLPLPKYSGPGLTDTNVQEEILRTGKITVWQSLLDKLSQGKIDWLQLKTYLPTPLDDLLTHPLVRLASDRKGQTLLHLAVIQNQPQWVKTLAVDARLRQRRDGFGWTPLELAEFLHQTACIDILEEKGKKPFFSSSSQLNLDDGLQEKFSYVTRPLFEKPQILHEIMGHAGKAKDLNKIPHEKIWLGIYFDQEISLGFHPKLSVRYVDDEIGYGVFAEQKIPPCSFVGEYVGIVKPRSVKMLKNKVYCVRYTNWQEGKKQFVIDAESHGNYTRFINHSLDANLALQSVYWRGLPRMVFVSLKEIHEGEQISFDYGDDFWKELKKAPKRLS